MCDNFFDGWDDMDDSFSDPGSDFEEDMADDAGGDWYEDDENWIDDPEIHNSSGTIDSKPDLFDLADAMLLGMIGGAFYDSATEEKQQFRRIKPEGKNKK